MAYIALFSKHEQNQLNHTIEKGLFEKKEKENWNIQYTLIIHQKKKDSVLCFEVKNFNSMKLCNWQSELNQTVKNVAYE